jgi:hypothetical protein
MGPLMAAITQHPVNNDEYQYGTETTATQFLGAITGNQGSKPILHIIEFMA